MSLNFNIKFERKDLWLLSAIVVFLVGVAYVIAYSQIPNPGHGGDNVYVYINGTGKTLQQAIDNGNFNSCSLAGGSYSLPIIHGHSGEEIIVNVNGIIKSLQQVINDASLVNANAGTSPSNFGDYDYGNNGDEIKIINKSGFEKTLQQAINAGDFKCTPSGLINLALTGTPSHIFNSNSPSGCPDYFGYGSLIQFDSRLNDNSSANPSIGIVGYGPGTVGFDFTSQIDLVSLSTINRIEVDFRGIVNPGTEYLKAYIYRTGSWTEVGSIAPYSMYGDDMAYLQTYQFTTGAPWINVEKVRIKAYSTCCPTPFQACVEGVVFEIRAFGTQ